MKNPETPQNRTTYHHGDLKAQLIEATRQLVEEKGPDHFSVSEACRRAGVSTAAPYKHFKDKGEMLRAVAMGGMERKYAMVLKELAPHAPGTLARIVALGRVYVGFARAEPGVFRLMFGLSKDQAADADLVAMSDSIYDMVKLEVARCDGRESVMQADEHLAFLLWSFVHGLSFLLIDGKLEQTGTDVDLGFVLEDVARRVVGARL